MLTRPGNGAADNNVREDLVTFDSVELRYSALGDVSLRYTLETQVTAKPLDWVGIFKSGCRDTESPLVCQWAPELQSRGDGTREGHVVFPAKFIQPLADQSNSYQFLYVSESNHILGASRPFEVMDTGDMRLMAGVQVTSAAVESRARQSTNQDATSCKCVSVSRELMSSDDEWELATHEELCKTNSSISDLSDIEILSKSPSKDAVKRQISGADYADGEDDAVDVLEFEKIKTWSLFVDDTPDNCSDPHHGTAASEALSTLQDPSIMGVREQEPEIIEVKRKLSRHMKIGSDGEDNNVAETAIVKECTKAKKMKKSSIASRSTTKQINTSNKIINAPISVTKLRIRNSQTVNSDSSSDNEEYSSFLHNCSVRKRKRKNNTGKSKCHPAMHHTPVSSESDLENNKKAIAKRTKRRKKLKVGDSVKSICNQHILRDPERSDGMTAEALDKFKRIVGSDEMASHPKSEEAYVNRESTNQAVQMTSEGWKSVYEDKIHEDTQCNLQVEASPGNIKVTHRKTKKADENIKYEDVLCYTGSVESTQEMEVYSRKEVDENKYDITSLIPQNVESRNKTIISSQVLRNPQESGQNQVIPGSLEDLMSWKTVMAHSENVDGIRKYTVIPLSNERMKYPEKATTHSKYSNNIEENRNNNPARCNIPDLLYQEETNQRKINNVENKIQDVVKCKPQISVPLRQTPTNINTMGDCHVKNEDAVSCACKLQDTEVAKRTRTNISKLAWVSDASCILDDTVNMLKVVEFPKAAEVDAYSSSISRIRQTAPAVVSMQRITEPLDTSKQKLICQMRIDKPGETHCKIPKNSGLGSEHLVGDGECKENRAESSDGYIWDISSRARMASKTPDGCLEIVGKKCLHKDKSRTKKETSMNEQPVNCGDRMAVVFSDRRQMEEMMQTSARNIPDTKYTEVLPPNAGEQQESSSSRCGDMDERILNVVLDDVVGAGSGIGCRERSTSEVVEEPLWVIDPEDLLANGSSVDAAPTSGRQARRGKIAPSKVIRASQSSFKAKYKCKGRTSSCQQFLKRGDICKWRQLRRLLMINKRRFKSAHVVVTPDDIGLRTEFEHTEDSRDSVEPEVTSRAELCPQEPALAHWSAVEGSSDAGAMDAETHPTYASVVKGSKQDTCMLNQEVQKNTAIEIPNTESFATTTDATDCLRNNTEELPESQERSESLGYGCVRNVDTLSMHEDDKSPGLNCENSPRDLTMVSESTCDGQTAVSGRDRLPPADPGIEKGYGGSNKNGHIFSASYDFDHVKMATRTKKSMKASEKLAGGMQVMQGGVGTMRVVQGGVKTAYVSPLVDEGAEGDDVTLSWPFPAAFKMTSALKEHLETGPSIPLITETTASDHGVFIQPRPAVVSVASVWLEVQPQTEHTSPVIPAAVSTSSEFELTSLKAGQMEVVELDDALERRDNGQHPQISKDSANDDQPLTWPLPVSKSSSSKFGLRDASRDQVDAHTKNSSMFFHRENLPHTSSVSGTSQNFIPLPAPIQSQLEIPRIRSFVNNAETTAAPYVAPEDSTSKRGQSRDRSSDDNTELKHRVNALEKQLDDLNSLLIKHRQEHLHGGGKGDDVTAPGCSRSGKFKLVKHKGLPKAKSKGGTRGLSRSSVETVSVKSKVRIKEARLADLENQLNVFKEALVAAVSKPVKIQVKCQKLHVKIRDGKCTINNDLATDGSVTMGLTKEENEARGSPSRVDNDDLVQETHLAVGDTHENESHSEVGDSVRIGTASRAEDHCLDHGSAERERSECLVLKSSSEMEAQGLLHASASRGKTGTSGVLPRNLVPETPANTSSVGYPELILETLSSAGDHLQIIPSRVDDCHVTHTTMSRLSSPDLVPDQKEKALFRAGSADLLQETPSGSPDLLLEMPSREKGCRLENSHSVIDGAAKATRRTTGKIPELSNIHHGSLVELDRQVVFTHDSQADVSQVSLVDVSSPTPASLDSPEHPYTQPMHLCSDSGFDVCCCRSHAPTTRFYTAEPNRFSLPSGVTLNRYHNLTMSDDMSDGNNDLTVPTSFDKNPLHVYPPDAASLSPYSRVTFMDKQTTDQSDPETKRQQSSCCRHGARTFWQDSQISISPEAHSTTSQNKEINKPVDYPYTLYGSNACRTKSAKQNQEHTFEGDHLKEGFSPWTSTTEKTYPKVCCWHSTHDVGNDIFDSKHAMEKILSNHTSSVNCYLSEDQRCSLHTTNACKHRSCVTSFQPDCSVKHHYSRERAEGRFSPQIPSSTSRFECVDSVGEGTDSRATSTSFNSRQTKNATLHNEHSMARYAVDDNTKLPASSKLPELCATGFHCSNSRGQSSNPKVFLCHRRLHDNNNYKTQERILSHKQFPKSLEHEAYFKNHHCHSPLCHTQRLVPADDDIIPSCPLLACEDLHLRQNNHCLAAQMQYAGQDPLMQLQNCSLPCSSLSRPGQPSLEENAHNLTCDHPLSKASFTTTSSINSCVERFPYNNHLKQADPTAERQYLAAVTEYLPSRIKYSNCCCLDGCACKRQIEGKQSCLLRQQN